MIAVWRNQTSSTSIPAVKYKCPHSDDFQGPMTGQQHRVDRQNAPEEEEAFQLSAGWSDVPMRRSSLLPVGHPFS